MGLRQFGFGGSGISTGGIGAFAVALQATTPGTPQTGNANISGTILLGNGTAAAPSYSLATAPDFGIFRTGNYGVLAAGGIGRGMFLNLVSDGKLYFGRVGDFDNVYLDLSFARGNVALAKETALAWSTDWGDASATADTFITRSAAATVNLGALDSATPVAQTLSTQSVIAGTSNTAGQPLVISGSVGTGAGAGGAQVRKTAYPGAAATVQNTLSTRDYLSSGWTTLTESSATAIATLSFGASNVVGADFLVTIHAADASNNQGMTYRVRVNSVRDAAGNTQSTVGIVDDSGTLPVAAGSGTLTATFTVTEGAGSVTLNANAVSSLTQTTLRATFQAVANGAGLAVAPAGF